MTVAKSLGAWVSSVQNARYIRKIEDKVGAQEFSIPTHMHITEKTKLLSLAEHIEYSGVILEIGSYLGASSCVLAAGARSRNGCVICVDTWENETMPDGKRDTYDIFKTNTKQYSEIIKTIRKRSDELEYDDVPNELEMVFIDGDHSYETVSHDLDLAIEKVKTGGTIAMHDVLYYSDVQKAMAERIVAGKVRLLEMVKNLGILQKL